MNTKELRTLFHYDPNTGLFTHLVSRGGMKVGSRAGHICKNGRVHIVRLGKLYLAHRLAWQYMTGRKPPKRIDHINGVPSDNRWCNLRKCTQSQNLCNARIRSDNTTGVKGVHKHQGKYRVQIKRKGKVFEGGSYCTIEEANTAASSLRTKLHQQFTRHN
jgi:hypothetical protein